MRRVKRSPDCGSGCRGYNYIAPGGRVAPARPCGYSGNIAPPAGWGVSAGAATGGGTATTVTVTNPGIDNSIIEIGCTYDAQLVRNGRVFRNYTINEDGTPNADVFEWLAEGATTFVPYVAATHGAYVECGDVPIEVTVCGCDDVAGDGSNIVQYITVSRMHATLGTYELGVFTDETQATAYTPVNPVDCDMLGSPAVRKEGRIQLGSGTLVWSPTPLTVSYTVSVQTIADLTNPPTFTDSFGNVTTFVLDEVQTFDHNTDLQSDGLAFVTVSDGDRVIISYIETGA